MDLFTYLLAKHKKFSLVHKGDLFSYLLGNKKILPADYTQVGYIESTGTQYIDSGVKLGLNDGFDIKFLTTNNPQTTGIYGAIFGGRSGSGNKEYQLTTFDTASLGRGGTLRWGSNSVGACVNAKITTNIIQKCSLKNKIYKAPDNTESEITVNSEDSVYNTYIFGLNNSGVFTQSGNGCRIYYLKLYNGDTLIRDFIPCIRNADNEVGMYDLVNNVFYTNQGTGEFTYE